jgi:MFS superfamily sulfate permease-like transporter
MENKPLPKTGFAALTAHFKDDFIAGLSVSFIALPLCIAISMASGFPPLAGLITAIVGGIFASRFAGSYVTISGPAAGLIVISLGAITSLGGGGEAAGYAGYPHALGAIVIGGAIIALFGILKLGKIGDYFPSAAVHGMLAAIGIIIMLTQLFTAIGVEKPDGELVDVIAEIPAALEHANGFAVIVSLITLGILIGHQFLKVKIIKMIPAPMWVLLIIVPIAQNIGLGENDFINMPDHIFGSDGIQAPSFEKIGTGVFWIAVAGFALVSGIESLLSAKAVDSIDPYKRTANLDKDLLAMGSGSSLAAAIGGLPMISEIVRSSANINNGGKTQWANFYHGVMLLVYVLVLSFAIELIPKAALAAMLVFTGFRLAHPREFRHMAKVGMTELIVFLSTMVGVIATDLLIGIGIGILVNYVIIFVKGASLRNLFSATATKEGNLVKFKGSLYFSNYLSLKKKVRGAIAGNRIVLDFSGVNLIDYTVMHHLNTYRKELKQRGIELVNQSMDHLVPVSNDELAERRTGIERRSSVSKLSSRQAELLALAAANNWNYTLKQDWNGAWDFYTITIRKKIVSLANLVSHAAGGVIYTSADVTTQEGARTTEDIQSVTVVKMDGLPSLPRFYMERETMVDKLNNLVLGGDINFDTHPRFSAKYILRGENESETRAIFTTEVLNFFEANSNLFMISNGDALLLRYEMRLLNASELARLLQKAVELSRLLKRHD